MPVRVQPEYDTYRYVEAPRRRSLPPPPPEPQRECRDVDRVRVVVEDRRMRRGEYY